MSVMIEMGQKAREAARALSIATTAQKNAALQAVADALLVHAGDVIEANARDCAAARENGIRDTMVDRLRLDESRIRGIAEAVEQLILLDDPIGHVDEGFVRPNGLRIAKTRVPLGTIGIIYESRPNVTVDAATLCLKAGNAVILRGGKEAIHSNMALCRVMREAISAQGLPIDAVQLVEDTSRETAAEMMRLQGYLDVLIPRGGHGLIQAVLRTATVPVIETGTGNCHIYVDRAADLDMAIRITDNAKTSRPSVCNAAESLLVHKDVAEVFLPRVKEVLDRSNVAWYGCNETRRILAQTPGLSVKPATDQEYATEFNDYILSVKVVKDIDEAIDHIAQFGTRHSEAIVTEDLAAVNRFTARVDAAAVYVNASTRFTDGGEFGFGAEIGISTQKLHARGPMGLRELTSVKYIVNGDGQIR